MANLLNDKMLQINASPVVNLSSQRHATAASCAQAVAATLGSACWNFKGGCTLRPATSLINMPCCREGGPPLPLLLVAAALAAAAVVGLPVCRAQVRLACSPATAEHC